MNQEKKVSSTPRLSVGLIKKKLNMEEFNNWILRKLRMTKDLLDNNGF
jgi:hypothetical protein